MRRGRWNEEEKVDGSLTRIPPAPPGGGSTGEGVEEGLLDCTTRGVEGSEEDGKGREFQIQKS